MRQTPLYSSAKADGVSQARVFMACGAFISWTVIVPSFSASFAIRICSSPSIYAPPTTLVGGFPPTERLAVQEVSRTQQNSLISRPRRRKCRGLKRSSSFISRTQLVDMSRTQRNSFISHTRLAAQEVSRTHVCLGLWDQAANVSIGADGGTEQKTDGGTKPVVGMTFPRLRRDLLEELSAQMQSGAGYAGRLSHSSVMTERNAALGWTRRHALSRGLGSARIGGQFVMAAGNAGAAAAKAGVVGTRGTKAGGGRDGRAAVGTGSKGPGLKGESAQTEALVGSWLIALQLAVHYGPANSDDGIESMVGPRIVPATGGPCSLGYLEVRWRRESVGADAADRGRGSRK
jgi:hypothetical protein